LSTLPIAFSSDQVWRKIQRENITSLSELSAFLELSPETERLLYQHPTFILNLPRRLASKIAKNDSTDPLFLQFVPLQSEQKETLGFEEEPIRDSSFIREAKLVHKYQGRALIVTTGACAMHCRYCFRKNFNYEVADKTFAKELEVTANDSSIQEIILSGGDPLSLSDSTLGLLLANLSNIPHLMRIRFHTRFPMGIPERITDSFLELLRSCSKQIWFVIHANHLNEFDDDVWEALKKIRLLGIPVLNQSVLLKGVNDDERTLKALNEALIDHGIMPYYLHQLDRVQGSAHFEVSEEKGKDLLKAISGQISGFGVPKYVREIPGQPNKTIL
jgi:EF-P beta-lysylation protein EpmB